MIQLPNGCSCSDPSVYPPDWKKCKTTALKKKWYIQYYFHDPEFKEKFKYGKLVIIKAGINRLKTLSERRAAISALLEDELNRLQSGWNAITNKTVGDFDFDYEIDPHTSASKAIDKAADKIQGAASTLSDIRTVKKHFTTSLRQLRLDSMPIKDLKRRHVKAALENLSNARDYSNARYNKVRAYVMMIFAELVEMETIEVNPVREIKKVKAVKKLKTILTVRERKKIFSYLKDNNYEFWRFCQIYFHSGSRFTELMAVQKKKVDIFNCEYVTTVKKGRGYEEVIKPINLKVRNLWLELMNDASTNDYLFSDGLIPGTNPISERQITRRWKRHVKDKLNIKSDISALRHLHTDLIAESIDLNTASAVNGHKSTQMALKHYAVNHDKRMLENMKRIDVDL